MPVSRSLYVALFILTASFGSVFTLLADLQAEVGFGDAALGLIAGVSFLTSVAAQLLLAPLADRGHARRLLAGSVVVAAIASAWFALAGTTMELIAARGVAGIGIGAFQPAARAVVAAADPNRAAIRLGRLSALETAGFVAGPVIAAVAFELWGLDAPFWLLAALLTATLPALSRASFPALESEDGAESRSHREVVRAILGRRQAVAAILYGAALFLPAGMYEAIWARFMDDLGASTLFVGFSLSLYGVPFALTAAFAGGVIDRRGTRAAVIIALAVIVPLTAVYGQLTSPWLLMILAMVEAVGNGLGMPASQAAMTAATGPGERAAGQGLVAAAGLVGAGVAAFLAAPLYAMFGPGVMFLLVAVAVAGLGTAGLRIDESARVAPRPDLIGDA
jgi:MFS family permease